MPKILDSMPMPEMNTDIQLTPEDSSQVAHVIVTHAPTQGAPIGADAQPEEENKYAHLFAPWDLIPPQVVVRRVRRIL